MNIHRAYLYNMSPHDRIVSRWICALIRSDKFAELGQVPRHILSPYLFTRDLLVRCKFEPRLDQPTIFEYASVARQCNNGPLLRLIYDVCDAHDVDRSLYMSHKDFVYDDVRPHLLRYTHSVAYDGILAYLVRKKRVDLIREYSILFASHGASVAQSFVLSYLPSHMDELTRFGLVNDTYNWLDTVNAPRFAHQPINDCEWRAAIIRAICTQANCMDRLVREYGRLDIIANEWFGIDQAIRSGNDRAIRILLPHTDITDRVRQHALVYGPNWLLAQIGLPPSISSYFLSLCTSSYRASLAIDWCAIVRCANRVVIANEVCAPIFMQIPNWHELYYAHPNQYLLVGASTRTKPNEQYVYN